uniref:Uncharacterized protein n=1 Tax=Stomoxys calcitrans TaxID=35570 RepID=A0A1I8Q3T7_STOCA|nr:unnamed protein product [Stomoxys calcitrans]
MRILLALLLCLASLVNAGYPPNFPKCKNADNECMKNAANEVLQTYYLGQSDINLIPFDPFHVKILHFKPNPSSPVNIDLKLTDATLEGFKSMKINKFQGVKADLSGRDTFSGIVPDVIIRGHYNVNGTVLILPITGDGQAVVTCKNVKFNFSYDFKPYEKNGKTYASLAHVKLDLEPEHVRFDLTNLFNGDKTLGDVTSQFINANWKELFNEMKPALAKAISLIVKSFINKFYETQPYADFFL